MKPDDDPPGGLSSNPDVGASLGGLSLSAGNKSTWMCYFRFLSLDSRVVDSVQEIQKRKKLRQR